MAAELNVQDKEAARQQMLLSRLLGDDPAGHETPWLQAIAAAGDAALERGLGAYRANAGALAERALAAAFPTLQQLIGEPSFAALARDFWRQQPPAAGDMGTWGEGLPDFVAAAASLADEPCLADVARVDWAVHVAERAADAAAVRGLELLAALDPSQLHLQLVAGTALVESAHPVVAIWHAHRKAPVDGDDRFAAVRAAYADGRGETALISRQGWLPCVLSLSPAEARFTRALLASQTLDSALVQAGEDFGFEAWLIAALQQQRLLAVRPLPLAQEQPA